MIQKGKKKSQNIFICTKYDFIHKIPLKFHQKTAVDNHCKQSSGIQN